MNIEEQPNTINDKYTLFVNFDLLNKMPNEFDGFLEIAKIQNTTKSKTAMFVFYDKKNYDKTNYIMYTRTIKKDGKNIWCAIIKDEFLERMRKNIKIASFGIFHELGHFLNGDYNNEYATSGKEMSILRRKAIENGKVLENELKADEFAVSQVGKSCAINFFDYSILRRKKIDNSKVAILELELRKKHIKNL